MTIFQRLPPPLTGASNARCKGYEKNAIFDQYFALSRKWYKIELYLQWPTNIFVCVLLNSTIFNDLERPVFKVMPLLDADCLTNGYRYGNSYRMRIGNRTQSFERYQFEWSWVTSNRDFEIIQRQITRKWHMIELCLRWPTNYRKTYSLRSI